MSQSRTWITLLSDLTVITDHGEYLGTWGTDESDAFFEFTPDGSDQVLLSDAFQPLLCKKIAAWYNAR